MNRRIAVAAAAVLLVIAHAEAGDPPHEFVLGPVVRAGRPVVVRVPGARRVRGGGSPWALPQGVRRDEFLLQMPRADVTLRTLEVDRGAGAPEVQQVTVRALPADRPVRAAFGSGADLDLAAADAGGHRLPTFAEAWLLVDEVGEAPDGVPPAARAALDRWRTSARPLDAARSAFQPLTHAPGPDAFRATAELAALAPTLPDDLVAALLILAIAEAVLVVLLRSRPGPSRALWTALPAALCLVWMTAAGRLPGAVRVTVVRLDGPQDRLVALRLEARRSSRVELTLPDGATVPAVLRFDADDIASVDDEIGRTVRVDLEAGTSRVIAWTEPAGAGAVRAAAAGVPPATAAWIRRLGLEVEGAARAPGPAVSGVVVTEAAAWSVAPTRK